MSENAHVEATRHQIDESRVIRVVGHSLDNGVVELRAALEDRFHNFRVRAIVDGGIIRSVSNYAVRFPYTMCPDAGGELAVFAGGALAPRLTDYLARTNARHHCTHQLDAAIVALALAGRGVLQCNYRIRVFGTEQFTTASIFRDEVEVLTLICDEAMIIAPPDLAGRPVMAGFTNWAATTLGAEAEEAALLARRMIFIGRESIHATNREQEETAPALAACWVMQPERAGQARRLRGQILPPDTNIDRLTQSDGDFLEMRG